MLSVPREIELTEDGRTYQRPAAELLALRGERTVHAAESASGADPVALGEVGCTFDLTARLEATGKTGLRLVTAPDGAEYLDILLDAEAGELVVDRDHASLDPRARGGTYKMPCPSGRPVNVRVVVDRSIAEIFLSTGQVLTARFYPVGEGPWRLEARTAPGARLHYTIDAWELLPLDIKETGADTSTRKVAR
jgi:beta-fructofuranosidase